MTRRVAWAGTITVALLGLWTVPNWIAPRAPSASAVPVAGAARPPASAGTAARVRAALAAMPPYFVENRGQEDPRVAYAVRGRDVAVYFTAEGVTFALASAREPSSARPIRRVAVTPEPPAIERFVVKLEFVGARPDARPRGLEATDAVFSHFTGPREQWTVGARAYTSIVYEDLWPGIDLVYSGASGRLKYSFLLRPGADPGHIRLAYRGAGDVRVSDAGELLVSTPARGFSDAQPYSYQEIDGRRVEVETAYALGEPGRDGARPFGFRLGAYDPGRALVLDPATFVYVGFIGGSESDAARGIAVDAAGYAYVTGSTWSSVADSFPAQVGPELLHGGGTDVWVAKVKADGSGLVYAGYLGGNKDEEATAIAVDASGNAYLTGATSSGGFANATPAGGNDAFVAKVSADGTDLVYARLIGGSDFTEEGRGIAVDADGNAYVTGWTTSSDFPVLGGPGTELSGTTDAFIVKVGPGGALAYAGFIGGAGNEQGNAVAVDATGCAYVVGSTSSDQTTFPAMVGPDLTYNGYTDAFVAKVKADGSGLVYAGYIGGAETDVAYAIAIDAAGNAYVAGETRSDQTTFPAAVGPDLTYNDLTDAFVVKVKADGTGLVYGGYIGGAASDTARGIAVDAAGNAYVAGHTRSDEGSFPVTVGPSLSFDSADSAAFVAKVRADGGGLAYAGYIGGALVTEGHGVAIDGQGNAYVAGFTESDGSTFPVTAGPDLLHNGGRDAFVAKVSGGGAGADLFETALTNPPLLAKIGTSFAVTDTVQNQGLTASTSSVTRYWLSLDKFKSAGDTLLTGTRSIAGLAPGATSTGTVNVTIPAATPPSLEYYLLACADHNGSVAESDEANNCRPSQTRVLAVLPDLAVIALINPGWPPIKPGASFVLTDTAKNHGAVASTAATTRYYLSLDAVKGAGDILLSGSRSVPALNPGATSGPTSVTVTVPASTALGLYTLLACADDSGGVAEYNEANNCLASTVKVTVARPDLVVTAVTNPAGPFKPGDAFTVNDTVANVSDVPTGATTTNRYYLSSNTTRDASDKLLTGTRTVPSLLGGAPSAGSKIVTIPTTSPTGTYYLLACADDLTVVAEVSETNNCKHSGTQVTVALPDLAAVVTIGPTSSVKPGGTFSVTDVTTNGGGVATGVPTTTRYYLSVNTTKSNDDRLLSGTRMVASLPANAISVLAGASQGTTMVTVPAATPLAVYRVLACADDTSVLPEVSESNNCGASSGTIQVTLPDLTEQAVTFSPATVARGGSLGVGDTVSNAGPVGAAASTTRYYLSGDQAKSSNDRLLTGTRSVPAFLLAGSSSAPPGFTVTVPTTVPTGSYYLIACADNLSAVAETSEANNCAASASQVTVTQ